MATKAVAWLIAAALLLAHIATVAVVCGTLIISASKPVMLLMRQESLSCRETNNRATIELCASSTCRDCNFTVVRDSNNSLSIHFLTTMKLNSSTFTCYDCSTSSDGSDTPPSDPVNYRVYFYYQPFLAVTQLKYPFIRFTESTVTCSAMGHPSASAGGILWMAACKDRTCPPAIHDPVTVSGPREQTAKFHFRATEEWTGSLIVCYLNHYPDVMASLQPYILGRPDLNITVAPRTLLLGSPAVVTCEGFGAAAFRLGVQLSAACPTECPQARNDSYMVDTTAFATLHFDVETRWVGSIVTCFLTNNPDVNTSVNITVQSTPLLTVWPKNPTYIQFTRQTLRCRADSPAFNGETEWAWAQPSGTARPSYNTTINATGGVDTISLHLNATPLWNRTVVTCALKEHPRVNSSVQIHVIGTNSLEIHPEKLTFVEGSELSIRCFLVDSAAVERAADLYIVWSLSCAAHCPEYSERRDIDEWQIWLTTKAVRQWHGARLTCRSQKHRSYSISETMTIIAPTGGLLFTPEAPAFLIGHRALVRCEMNASGASTELDITVGKCESCRLDRNYTTGSIKTAEFSPSWLWNGSELTCYQLLDPSVSASLAVIVHEAPRLRITPSEEVIFNGEEVTLQCRGTGLAPLIGLRWVASCTFSCPEAYPLEGEGDVIAYSFIADRKWNRATITCALQGFPTVNTTIKFTVTDIPAVEILNKEEKFSLNSIIVLYCAASAIFQPGNLKWNIACRLCADASEEYVSDDGGKAVRALKFRGTRNWDNVTVSCFSVKLPRLVDELTIRIDTGELAVDTELWSLILITGAAIICALSAATLLLYCCKGRRKRLAESAGSHEACDLPAPDHPADDRSVPKTPSIDRERADMLH